MLKIKNCVLIIAICVVLFGLGSVSQVSADWRPYAYSYSYGTAYAGEKEIELYTDYDYKGASSSLKNQLEFEYGITDHLMASVYGVFTGGAAKNYTYNQTKLQTRYRIGEEGQFFVDFAEYMEYKIPASGGNGTIELKQILSKELGEYNLTANIIFETDLAASAAWEKEYTLGLSKMLPGSLRVGLEAKGTIENNPTLFIAPSVSAIWNNIKMNLAVGFGATSASKTMYIRHIFAYEF